ncbi:MAG: hypothetical protein JXQ73_05230 [Phycisphaerae bacterium]|nr:hypothetical protein [Phycisphaerae bacterium]
MMHVGFRALIGGLVFAPVGLLVLGLMSVFPSRAVLMFLGYAWLLATAGVFLVGAWLFTTPDPRGTPGSSVEKVRTGCRTAVGMVALLAALSWGSGLWPRWVYGVILVATVLGLAALIYLLLIHVVHLADRLERQPPWRQRRFLRLKKSDVRIQDTCRMGQRIALLAALVGIITVIARATGPFSAVPFATSSLATIFFLLLLGLASVLWDLLAHCREAFRDATAQAELNWLRVTGEIEVEREAP